VVTEGDNKQFSGISYFLFCLILFTIISSLDARAQRKSDIGFFAGTSYYMGDLNPGTHFKSPGIAVGPIFRYNFHKRSSVRASGIYHTLSAESPTFANGAGGSFSADFMDLAVQYEFNFIPYQTGSRKLKYSLYTAAGLGYHLAFSGSSTGMSTPANHFMIPFSIGFKFNAGTRLSAGFEYSPRKTFTDTGLDGITNIGEENSDFHLLGNNDWYNFAGVFVTYKIFNYREDCPAYD